MKRERTSTMVEVSKKQKEIEKFEHNLKEMFFIRASGCFRGSLPSETSAFCFKLCIEDLEQEVYSIVHRVLSEFSHTCGSVDAISSDWARFVIPSEQDTVIAIEDVFRHFKFSKQAVSLLSLRVYWASKTNCSYPKSFNVYEGARAVFRACEYLRRRVIVCNSKFKLTTHFVWGEEALNVYFKKII
jgi:hypothetical protein